MSRSAFGLRAGPPSGPPSGSGAGRRASPVLPAALTVAFALVVVLVLSAAPALAATDVDDGYEVELAPGAVVTDDLGIRVPGDFDDPDLDWQVEVAGDDGPRCGAFTLTLIDGSGAEGTALTGAKADNGRVEVRVRVLATGDDGSPAPAGRYGCGLRISTGGYDQDVQVTLRVRGQGLTATTSAVSTTTSTTLPATTTTAPPDTTAVAEPASTADTSTTTSTTLLAVSAARDGGNGGGGLPFSGTGPLAGAMAVAALGLLMLGGGLLATSSRPQAQPPKPGSGSRTA